MYILFSTHYHGTVCMVHTIVTDRAEEGSPEGAQASGAHHDHAGLLPVGRLDDELARVAVEVGDDEHVACFYLK